MDAFEVEAIAIDWASKKIEEEKWFDLLWFSDNVKLVNEIKNLEEPTAWKSRFIILQIRSILFRLN